MKSMFDLSGKTIVVTGGGGLLGQAFGRGICQAGGRLVIAEKQLQIAEQARESILCDCPGASVQLVELDIVSECSVRSGLAECVALQGTVDALVNNAYPRNSRYGKPFFEVEYDSFCENLGMNLGGYFVTTKVFAEYFRTKGQGNIVNIASIYGVVAPSFDLYSDTEMTMPVEYACIKSGLIHLTKYTAKYLAGTGVRVNALTPGGIRDGQDPRFIERYNAKCLTKGMLDRDDMIGGLVFLLSDASSYVNGHNLVIDDGFTV